MRVSSVGRACSTYLDRSRVDAVALVLRLKIFDPNISNRAQILLRGRPQAHPRGGTLRAPLVLEKHKVVGQNFRDRALVL